MRNIQELYRKSHLVKQQDNELALMKQVGELQADFDLLSALVKATVTFNANGGLPAPDAQQIAFGQTATRPETDPAKEGYEFKNWYIGDTGNVFDFATKVKRNYTLTAQYDALYTVTYALDGGSGTAPTETSKKSGQTFTVASGEGITKEGKVFGGWNDGTTTYQAGDTYTVGTANVTLTAVWE